MEAAGKKALTWWVCLACLALCGCIRVYYVTIKDSPGVTLYVVADVPKEIDAAADLQAQAIPIP